MTITKKLSLLAAVGMVAMAAPAFAATITWSGGGSNVNDWSIGKNWVGGNAPGASDAAVFPTGFTVLITTGIPSLVDEIRVNGTAQVTLSQPSLTLVVNTVDTHNSSQLTFTSTSVMATVHTATLADTSQLTFDSNVTATIDTTLSSLSGTTFTVDGPAMVSASTSLAGTTVVNGTLTNASSSFAMSGNMTINNAAIMVNQNNLGTSSAPTITIASGGTMKFFSSSAVGITGNATLSLANTAIFVAHDCPSGCDIASTITLNDVAGAVWQAEIGSAASSQLKFENNYALAGDLHLADVNSTFFFAASTAVGTSGNYFGLYGSPCAGKAGTGAFAWGSSIGYPASNCP